MTDTPEQYLARILELARPVESETVPLCRALGRFLAEDVIAPWPVPNFDNSAMDGYAVRAGDAVAGARLRVIGDAPAGATCVPAVKPGTAVRIMTGAPVPPGADAVVKVEDTGQDPGPGALPATVKIVHRVASGQNIRSAGEDISAGARALGAGLRITPAVIASLASLGVADVAVRIRPRVGIMTTGTELVEVGASLGVGQIPDSNLHMTAALATAWGADVVGCMHVPDSPDIFRATCTDLAQQSDVLVTSGGVSAGAFDVVKESLDDMTFTKVAMQPGKPQGFGRFKDTVFLGFPGNPVSCYVSAQLFLRPLLRRMAGADTNHTVVQIPAGSNWRSPLGRTQFVPAMIIDGAVIPTHVQAGGSHLVASLAATTALAVVPAGQDDVRAGDSLDVILID